MARSRRLALTCRCGDWPTAALKARATWNWLRQATDASRDTVRSPSKLASIKSSTRASGGRKATRRPGDHGHQSHPPTHRLGDVHTTRLTTMIGDHKHVVHDRCAMDVRRLAAAIQDAEDASARKTLDAIAAGTERLVTVSAAAPYGRSFDQDATACSL